MDLSVLSFEGLRRARNLHPLFVHYPIALLPTSLCFYAIGYVARRRDFQFAGRATLALAMLFTILAWFTGFRAEATLGVVEPRSELLRAHLACGSLLFAMTVFLFSWSRAHIDDEPRTRWGFLAFLALAVAASMLTADLGAQLVFRKGASVERVQNPRRL